MKHQTDILGKPLCANYICKGGEIMEREDTIKELMKFFTDNLKKLNKARLRDIINSNDALHNMSLSQFNVLFFLGGRETAKMKDIRDELGVKASSVTHLVDNLAKLDLVERSHSLDDRRVIEVKLSEKGKYLFEELDTMDKKYFRTMLEKLEEDEQKELLRILLKMNALFAELL